MFIGDNIFITNTPSEVVDIYYSMYKLNPKGFTLPYLTSTFSTYHTDIAEYTFWCVRLKIITESVRTEKSVDELDLIDSSIDFIIDYLDTCTKNFDDMYLPNRLNVRGWLYDVANTLKGVVLKYEIKTPFTDYLLDK